MFLDYKNKIKELNLKNIKLTKIYETENCIICLNPFINYKDYKIIIICGHIFYYNCIKKCSKCPLCKYELNL